MRFVVVAAVLMGCAQAAPNKRLVETEIARRSNSSRHVGDAATLEPMRWEVGQWAMYKRLRATTVGDDRAGAAIEYRAVVAIDGCGVWIKVVKSGYDYWASWTFCFSDLHTVPSDIEGLMGRLNVAVVESDAHPGEVIDFRSYRNDNRLAEVRPVIAALLLPSWPGDATLKREDIAVSAGTFRASIRQELRSTDQTLQYSVWSHPDVPFNGRVKLTTSDGLQIELLDYGMNAESSFVEELAFTAQPKPVPRLFGAMGLRMGRLSGHMSESSAGTLGLMGSIGSRLTDTVDVLIELADSWGAYSPDPNRNQDAMFIAPGVRWRPWGISLPPSHGPYFQASVGYAELDRSTATSSTTAATGAGIGATVGWILYASHDVAARVELDDHIAFFGSDEGIRHSVAFSFVFELHVPYPEPNAR
jgi:hypothetical protein